MGSAWAWGLFVAHFTAMQSHERRLPSFRCSTPTCPCPSLIETSKNQPTVHVIMLPHVRGRWWQSTCSNSGLGRIDDKLLSVNPGFWNICITIRLRRSPLPPPLTPPPSVGLQLLLSGIFNWDAYYLIVRMQLMLLVYWYCTLFLYNYLNEHRNPNASYITCYKIAQINY